MTQVLAPGPKWWRRIINVVALIALLVMSVMYLNHLQKESDKRWCRLLSALTTDVPPPTTERAREIAGIMQDMKRDFDCL